MARADSRPRVHLWPRPDGADWSLSPTATHQPASDHGAALNLALEQLGKRAAMGAVVIIEPAQ